MAHIVCIVGVHLATTEAVYNYHHIYPLFLHLLILFSGAFIAFMLEFSEFMLVARTNCLTLSIAGVVKVK